jgi:hypothetical protein
VGANAVIHTTYRQQVSWFSWFSMGGQGLAVVAEPEYVTCPECAERVRRAAKKCRHCGATLPEVLPKAGWYPDPTGDSRLRYWDGSDWTDHTD